MAGLNFSFAISQFSADCVWECKNLVLHVVADVVEVTHVLKFASKIIFLRIFHETTGTMVSAACDNWFEKVSNDYD